MDQAEVVPNGTTTGLENSTSSLNSVDRESSTTSSANVDTQQSKWTASSATSVTASPLASRESSPSRPNTRMPRTSRSTAGPGNRSRKNSLQDPSPSRSRLPSRTTPTPAAQRQQISAATTPALPPPSSSETTIQAPVPRKQTLLTDASKEGPRWPVSPRLKSPPPSLNKPAVSTGQSRREADPPSIHLERATPSPHPHAVELGPQGASDAEGEENAQLQGGTRTPGRGSGSSSVLETVQEVSQPNTPKPDLDLATEKLQDPGLADSAAARSDPALNRTGRTAEKSRHSDSGSDSGSTRAKTRRSSSATPAPLLHSRQSSSALKFNGKGPSTAETSQHITVEEEEVDSVPRLGLGLAPISGASVNGSLKTKASSETIRPKKEKKKLPRKAASVASGPVSSKADIFEAKVASAVEEANSSDSDETFVYDSNPPDASDRPRRYHSRTPSATSMASQADRNGMRSIHSVLEGGAPSAAKKNMKFVNTFNSNGTDNAAGDDDGKGTSRSNAGSARGTGRHHHHHGQRWGRGNGNNHTSLFDNESPFPNAARSRLAGPTSRPSSTPPSPRVATNRAGQQNNKRQLLTSGVYDLDDTTTGADDERTPLLTLPSGRSPRSPRARRNMYRNRGDLENGRTYQQSNSSFLNRFASCLVLTIMLLLVISGAIGFMFATSQPLTDIKLVKIGNVLASSQELMMDISVEAHNPNVVVVMIDSADLEVFAKSRHAGTDSEWWKNPDGDDMKVLDDPLDDQPPDSTPEDDASPNMRLGSILEFDSPLTYEGSFFQSVVTTSTGELRLAKPGNTTDHGSERWERVLSDEFTLIVKGVLKYTLPLSQKVRSVAISGKTLVKPNSANDPTLRPNGTEVEVGIS